MEIGVSLNGKYPRGEEVIRVSRDYERGRASLEELERAYSRDYEEVRDLQEDFNIVSDGLLVWDDILRPLSAFVKGTEVDGLVRYFETNTFVRKLKFKSRDVDTEKISRFFRFGNLAILPGPYTIKTFSEGLSMLEISEVISHIIRNLKGYEYIYLQEPSLVFYPDESIQKEYGNCVDTIKSACENAKLIINTYFAPVNPILEFLLSLNIDGFGVDFTFNDIEYIRKVWRRDVGIVAGIVDTTNSLIEEYRDVERVIKGILDMDVPFAIFTGSADFEFLPRRIADIKVKNLKSFLEVSYD